jgi:hypothetical protein
MVMLLSVNDWSCATGAATGDATGDAEGLVDGLADGLVVNEGRAVGKYEGEGDAVVGEGVGDAVGEAVGLFVGSGVGSGVGVCALTFPLRSLFKINNIVNRNVRRLLALKILRVRVGVRVVGMLDGRTSSLILGLFVFKIA